MKFSAGKNPLRRGEKKENTRTGEEAVESSGKRADIFAPRSATTDGWTDVQVRREREERRRGEKRKENEKREAAMNFALPEEDEAKERERDDARARARAHTARDEK